MSTYKIFNSDLLPVEPSLEPPDTCIYCNRSDVYICQSCGENVCSEHYVHNGWGFCTESADSVEEDEE